MGRVLKPSVKAISVSQTCCFPTESTCQSGDLQLHGKHTHRHTHTHPFEYTDIKDDIFILSVRPNTHPHVFTQKRARMQKRRQKKNIRANTWVETKSSHTHKYAHPRAWTNTWLARRFTPVWKDKHQPINKSVSRETCWHAQQQGSRSGRDERKVRGRQKKVCWCVCVCVCACVCGHTGWLKCGQSRKPSSVAGG